MVIAGPSWLLEDVERIEDLLVTTADSSSDPLVSEASTHLIKAGGKRVRPALVMLTSRAGQSGGRSTDLAAAAVELVHLATLYHDDVIDETPTRRGVPTVHSKWGIEVAVLAGDYLFARGCALGAEAGGEVPGILARAIAQVCEGQIVETGALGNPRRPVTDYIETIRRKTAALFRAACELGAATSGITDGLRGSLADYGEKVGLAFQIVDDVLDFIGEPEIIGKMPGTDLREGVFTLPVLLACEREPALAQSLAAGDRDLGALLPKLESTGAIEDSLRTAARLGGGACSDLQTLPAGEVRDALEEIVDSVLAQARASRAA
jgi:heptaprenyl diphosphate synthase